MNTISRLKLSEGVNPTHLELRRRSRQWQQELQTLEMESQFLQQLINRILFRLEDPLRAEELKQLNARAQYFNSTNLPALREATAWSLHLPQWASHPEQVHNFQMAQRLIDKEKNRLATIKAQVYQIFDRLTQSDPMQWHGGVTIW